MKILTCKPETTHLNQHILFGIEQNSAGPRAVGKNVNINYLQLVHCFITGEQFFFGKISYFLTSFYYEVLYISSILAGGHTGVVTFLV